ncbi:MAG: hypothetical protein Q8Q39_04150 [bacterium]|nr:hypothetical protein [bacterium]
MTEIIPSINHSDPDEIRRRIRLVEPYVQWVHVDVSDGIFASTKIFNDPAALYDFKTPLNIELHLMIDKPEDHLDAWLKTAAKRFLVHSESTRRFNEISQRLGEEGRQVGLALNPETSEDAYDPYAVITPYVLILGVTPGPSGQVMQPHIIQKVMRLRHNHPDCIIEVDGGVSLKRDTARQALRAGANALCCGNEIFSSSAAGVVITRLQNLS